MKFRIFVTVQEKKNKNKVWNKVAMALEGNSENLNDVIREYNLIKGDVNTDLQKKGIPFNSVDIFISTNR